MVNQPATATVVEQTTATTRTSHSGTIHTGTRGEVLKGHATTREYR